MKPQPVGAETVFISPSMRDGAIVHLLRGSKGCTAASPEELLYIGQQLPEIAAFASAEVGEALAALHRARVSYEQAMAVLERERAELAARCAAVGKLKKPLAELGRLAGDIAP